MTAKNNLTTNGKEGVSVLRARLRAEEMLGHWAGVVTDPGCGIRVTGRGERSGSRGGQFLRADYLTVEAVLSGTGFVGDRLALARCWVRGRGPGEVSGVLALLRDRLVAAAGEEAGW